MNTIYKIKVSKSVQQTRPKRLIYAQNRCGYLLCALMILYWNLCEVSSRQRSNVNPSWTANTVSSESPCDRIQQLDSDHKPVYLCTNY